MTEDQKKRVAVFRFGVISDFVNCAGPEYGKREKLIREKCARKWDIPFSEKTRICRSTIQRWIGLYEAGNGRIESLFPKDRNDKGQSRTIDTETESALVQVRKEFPHATAESLMEIMQERGLVTPGTGLNLSGVYRLLHSHNLMRPNTGVREDRRKFEAQYPNDLWQSDVMHGPRVDFEGKRKKTYLIAIIDDHSRLIPHARFYFSEKLAFYLDAFEKALLRRGIPRKLYVDNGAAFRSRHLEYIAASLGIALIHSRPYKPQGKAKSKGGSKLSAHDFSRLFPVVRLGNSTTLWAIGWKSIIRQSMARPGKPLSGDSPPIRNACGRHREISKTTFAKWLGEKWQKTDQ